MPSSPPMGDPPTRWVVTGLLVLTLIRIVLAAWLPLVPDEAYYWTWSRSLQPGYFDHPPMVALWVRLGTALAGQTTLGIRLLGPIGALLGSLLVFDTGRRLFTARAGLAAAVLLNATLMAAAGSVIMTPDTPLLLFWIATLWAAARGITGGGPGWWLAAGLFCGLALMSKYTAILLPAGIGLTCLWTRPATLRRPWPWLGLTLAGLVFAPVVAWNAAHDWASFLHQGGRVAHWYPQWPPTFLAELIGGQAGLATPLVFVLFVLGTAAAIRAAWRTRAPAETLLAALTLPAALIFLQHAIGDRVQGNWPVIIYPGAALAAGALVTGDLSTRGTWPAALATRLAGPSVSVGLLIFALATFQAVNPRPIPLPVRDPMARQLAGWNQLADRVHVDRGGSDVAFVAAEPYGLASELAWSLPMGTRVIGAGPYWLSFDLASGQAGTTGLLIRPAHQAEPPDPAVWRVRDRLPDLTRPGSEDAYTVYLVELIGPDAVRVLPPRN